MKFTDGIWLVKEGFEIQNPKEVFDYSLKADTVTVYAPFKKIKSRGDTLNLGLMTTEISSPREDVFTVRLKHHDGGKRKSPAFGINEQQVFLNTTDDEKAITIESGNLKVAIDKENYALSFYGDGQFLTKSDVNGQGYITSADQNYIRERLDLGVGENIYGLGERFTNFVKNGQTVDIWNKDGGTSSDQSYKNIPFFVSNKGYGVFVNHPEHVSFEVGSEHVSKNQFSVAGEALEYMIIYGPTMEEILRKYTDLTGKPALPPAWSFGLWLSTSFCTDYDEATVNSFIDGMKERDIPLDVFHFDCFWMKDFEWCNFEWDRRVFPEPEKMLANLKAKGLKICVWINPYIAQKSALFAEGKEHGYFIKNKDGSVWQWDLWQGGQAIVDFTNPAACAWYRDKLSALMDMGVDAFKTDFGERIPTDVQYFDGSDPEKMHNYYAYIYNEVVFDLLKEKRGEQDAVLFARSATVGSQKFPVHWGGDCLSTYSSMAESLRGGLSFMLSGFGFWSHDIGGFEEGATPDIYKRWTQFGLLSSHSRYHGNVEYRVPWIFDEEAVDVTRKFTKLKMRLMPYLFKQAVTAHKDGMPMMRPMVLSYMEDPAAATLDRQYMLGENLLVAPIFNEEGRGEFYLPKGKWTNILTDEVYDGSTWVSEHHDYMSFPLLAKENSIIVCGSRDDHAEYDYAENPTIHVYGFETADASAETVIYQANGAQKATIRVENNNSEITVHTDGLANYEIIWHKQHESGIKTYETSEKTIKLA
ncbi:alpha-xylosidase [Listeria cornellensis]|uniref:alpha-D-xyloside xylohydrolase n=1 Tax=Listeria cornellensis FSL F6-0969 TaxID=1265820 RepID=W7CCL7_9LIST|nr:alpha-xylosidase [Listeria cornellensis]EUJ30533.1 alpha-glucosidase [Listeria cornellensis FSL F6-0969]